MKGYFSLDSILSFIKIFFIVLYTYILNFKLINDKKRIRITDIVIVLSLACVYDFVRKNCNFFYSTIIMLLIMSVIISNKNQKTISYNVLVGVFSLSINYVLFFISTSIGYVIYKLLDIKNEILIILAILIIYTTIIYKFYKWNKLKNGLFFLREKMKNEFFLVSIFNISVIIIFFVIVFQNNEDVDTVKWGNGIILLCMVLFIALYQSIDIYYKQKLLIKDLDETKEELAKTKKELAKAEKENLEASKRSHSLVHRQKALEFQISELRKSKNSKDINKIKQDVENLSKELYGKEVMTQLSKTNIELIDNMFRYMQFECYKNEIRFDLQICGNIYKMINNVINKETLEILLADHVKNAIIAVKHSENSNKSILVKLGKIGDCYGVCIYDSGIEFKEETLKTLGKKPSSTHLDEGGSGMGFLNTFDTLNKYKASLIIDEIGMPCEENYTKVIMIKFDGKNEFKVNSYRQQKAV